MSDKPLYGIAPVAHGTYSTDVHEHFTTAFVVRPANLWKLLRLHCLPINMNMLKVNSVNKTNNKAWRTRGELSKDFNHYIYIPKDVRSKFLEHE